MGKHDKENENNMPKTEESMDIKAEEIFSVQEKPQKKKRQKKKKLRIQNVKKRKNSRKRKARNRRDREGNRHQAVMLIMTLQI